jgi:hypothetical protein
VPQKCDGFFTKAIALNIFQLSLHALDLLSNPALPGANQAHLLVEDGLADLSPRRQSKCSGLRCLLFL